jgi:outer membrane receptor for ferrienterochelin and colicins
MYLLFQGGVKFGLLFLGFAIVLFGGNCSLLGQSTGSLQGTVGHESGYLAGATLTLQPGNLRTSTDTSGKYFFPNILAGEYRLQAQFIGHLAQERKVSVRAGEVTKLNFSLEDDYLQTEEVVISSNRNEQKRNETSVVVGVVDSRTLNMTNSVVLSEGLGFQPGLRVENNCNNCGFTQLRMNGLPGPYSQILINNRPVFSALNGVYGLEQIPANLIDRVEIVRGGGSAAYGSNAIAGTVNILTKEPIENDWQVGNNIQFIGGSYDNTFTANGTLVSKNQRAGATIFGMNRNRQEYDANGDGYSEITRLRNTTIGIDAYIKPTINSKLSLNMFFINEFRRGGNKLDEPPHRADIAEELKTNNLNAALTYEVFTPNLLNKFSVYLSGQNADRDSYYGTGMDLNAYGKTKNYTVISGFQYTRKLPKLGSWASATNVLGAEFKVDDVRDRQPAYNRSINQQILIGSIFEQFDLRIRNRVTLSAGARFDYHNRVKRPIISPRLGFVVNAIPGLNLRANYAFGFRAPQAFDEDLHLASVGGSILLVRLSPNLRTETSHSITTTVDFTRKIGYWQFNFLLSGFYTRLLDPFVFNLQGVDTAGNTILLKSNGAGAQVYGLNFEGAFAYTSKYTFELGLTWQQALNDGRVFWSGDSSLGRTQLLRTPNLYGYFTFSAKPWKTLALSLTGTYTGPMLAPHYAGFVASDRIVRTPNFFELNVKVSYDFKVKEILVIQLYAGAQNLANSYQSDFDRGANRDANYVYGPIRPRAFFAGIKFGSF